MESGTRTKDSPARMWLLKWCVLLHSSSRKNNNYETVTFTLLILTNPPMRSVPLSTHLCGSLSVFTLILSVLSQISAEQTPPSRTWHSGVQYKGHEWFKNWNLKRNHHHVKLMRSYLTVFGMNHNFGERTSFCRLTWNVSLVHVLFLERIPIFMYCLDHHQSIPVIFEWDWRNTLEWKMGEFLPDLLTHTNTVIYIRVTLIALTFQSAPPHVGVSTAVTCDRKAGTISDAFCFLLDLSLFFVDLQLLNVGTDVLALVLLSRMVLMHCIWQPRRAMWIWSRSCWTEVHRWIRPQR